MNRKDTHAQSVPYTQCDKLIVATDAAQIAG
jgi:hypothetical protein